MGLMAVPSLKIYATQTRKMGTGPAGGARQPGRAQAPVPERTDRAFFYCD